MAKEYYNIKCKDGIDRQVWDIEKALAIDVVLNIDNISIYPYYEFVRFCDAFEYIARAGRKDINTKDEDIAKAKDNLRQIKWKEFLSFMIAELCEITDIGEDLKKLVD